MQGRGDRGNIQHLITLNGRAVCACKLSTVRRHVLETLCKVTEVHCPKTGPRAALLREHHTLLKKEISGECEELVLFNQQDKFLGQERKFVDV